MPTPLPNIGKSGDSPKGYSKSVTIEGKPIAITGASFGSQGDMASKGTGGGLISSNTHGPTKFLGPGSMNVQIEGKNVQLLSDPMLNNCGPSGSPANAATMTGIIQTSGMMAVMSAGFECASPKVDSGAAQEEWMCAAKQIMQRLNGHKPQQLIERLFYPVVEGFKPIRGPTVTFLVRIEDPVTKTLSAPQPRTQTFKSGEDVPSCAKCQANLPGMYCKTQCG